MWSKVNPEILKEIFTYPIAIKELPFAACKEGMSLLNNLGRGNRLSYIFLLIRDTAAPVSTKALNLFLPTFNKQLLGLLVKLISYVGYGNVGAPDRLDFTVMGPAVNRTARLEGLTKTLGVSLLMSRTFVSLIEDETTSLGLQEMKGVAEKQEVFSLTCIS